MSGMADCDSLGSRRLRMALGVIKKDEDRGATKKQLKPRKTEGKTRGNEMYRQRKY